MAAILQNIQQVLDQPNAWPAILSAVAGALVLSVIYAWITGSRPYAGIPLITLNGKPSRMDFMMKPRELLAKAEKETKGAPFQIVSASMYKIIVPSRFADELKSHPDLDFQEATAKDFFVDIPGFDGIKAGLRFHGILIDTVRTKLTQYLNLVTDGLVDECDDSITRVFGEEKRWKIHDIKQDVLNIVARLSSRVFLGAELARNEEWLQIAKDYTMDVFMAQQILLALLRALHSIAPYFIPICRRLRKEVKDGRRLIDPVVEQRIKTFEAAKARGEKRPKSDNAIDWMIDTAKGREYDFAAGQLALSLAAIHTTSEVTTQALYQLCANPEVVEPLREEVTRVLRQDGWAKTSLYKMQLLDSFLKEVQRLGGTGHAFMHRFVRKPITLSDGTVLPKDAVIYIPNDKVLDPNTYADPQKFDAARFLKLRSQPGEENRHQFVTTSPEHMGFGHGAHACPGRFFASNEMKIALCFFLLRYDFAFAEGQSMPPLVAFEANHGLVPDVKMQLRRRTEEIDLLTPQG